MEKKHVDVKLKPMPKKYEVVKIVRNSVRGMFGKRKTEENKGDGRELTKIVEESSQ